MHNATDTSSHSEKVRSLAQLSQSLPLPATNKAWGAAATNRDWNEVLRLVEETLQTDPKDIEARLTWVRAQAELGLVPLAALTAPIDELVTLTEEAPDQVDLTLHVLGVASSQLLERSNTRVGLLTLERLLGMGEKFQKLSNVQRREILETLLEIVQHEFHRAESKRESKTYVASLNAKGERWREQLETLKREKGEPPRQESAPVTEEPKGARQKKFITSKSIVSTAAEDTERPFVWSAPTGEGGQVPQVSQPQQAADRSSRNVKKLIEVIGALMIFLGLLWIITHVFMPSQGAENEQLAFAMIHRTQGNLELPTLEYSGKKKSLDSVTRRLESMKSSEPESSTPDAGNADGSKSEVVAKKEESTPATSEPKVDPKKTPDINPEKLAQAVVESLGQAGAVSPVKGAQGNPPDPYNGAGSRNLDGSPLRSYEVEQLNPPLMYKTIAATRVLSAPSILAEPLASLRADARIQVVARMGQWLEIRSTGGRRGYIYSQDAASVDRK